MPAERSGPRIGRKGHYACEFCRARKLRCDRQLPCANCTSRGRSCGFESENNPDEIQQSNEHTPIITPTQPTTPYESLLLEVQSLRKIAQELETRISLEMQQRGNHSLQPEPSSLKKAYGPLDALSHTQCPVGNKIAYLERVGLGQSSYEPSSTDEVIVKVDNIRNIHQRPKHTTDSGQVVRCVWFPRYEETKALAEAYISNVGYIAHIMHYPSLADTVDEVYQQLAGQEPKKLGHFVLILAIIANSTYSWVNRGDRDDIFPSSAAAYSQVTLWVKATQDVLNASQQSPPFSIEMVQGIIMLSFIVANMEGFSPRYRSLMSTALWVSRELGLHRWDEPGNVRAEDTIKLEVGRRVWWYLVSTDWLLASRYRIPSEGIYQVHPRHTIVRKPRNINDEDLVTYAEGFEKPLSQPTEMSYFLQRMRLAEVSRSMVDRTAQTGLGKRSYADVVAADIELDKFSNEIPSFFNLKDYHEYSDHLNSTNMTVQSYMLKCHVHMQRCRLHIPYLTMDTDNILYTYSRKSCLMAAREIIRNELQLEKSNHPFVSTRLRFSATLHGVFMASIVLLMDACVNRKDLLGEVRDNELSEAFRILECARSQSLAASSLLESLMQTLGQHGLRTKKPFRAQQQQSEEPTSVASLSSVQPVNPGLCPPLSAVEVPLPEAFIDPARMYVVTTPNEQEKRSVDDEGHIAQFSELAQNLEGFPNMENFQWENVFSTVDSSFL